jgi:hypothetical protein
MRDGCGAKVRMMQRRQQMRFGDGDRGSKSGRRASVGAAAVVGGVRSGCLGSRSRGFDSRVAGARRRWGGGGRRD